MAAAAAAPKMSERSGVRALTARMTSQVVANTSVGAHMRRSRSATQDDPGRPANRWEFKLTAELNPPTTKNNGITCNSQVIQLICGASSRAFLPTMEPLLSPVKAMAHQCPTATVSMATAR